METARIALDATVAWRPKPVRRLEELGTEEYEAFHKSLSYTADYLESAE
jgi:hypothetical protein